MAHIVKITTKISVLDLFCPHYCWGCGRLGTVLCDCCKNYILANSQNYCPNCHAEIERKCEACEMPFDATFMVGFREGVLMRLVEDYKYKSVRAIGEVLAELVLARLPVILGEVVVVPLPTTRSHIRQRGLDHTLKVAEMVAAARGWRVERLLERAANTVQVGATAAKRVEQAGRAYRLDEKTAARNGLGVLGENGKWCLRSDVTYLLFDDVWTTGASMGAGAEILRAAGAEKVMAAVISISKK